MIAVPFASPSGISPGGLLVKSSSSWACDIFNRSGTVIAMICSCYLSCRKNSSPAICMGGSECLEELDQRALVRVGQARAELVAAILDQVGTVARLEERGGHLPFQQFFRRGGVEEFDQRA